MSCKTLHKTSLKILRKIFMKPSSDWDTMKAIGHIHSTVWFLLDFTVQVFLGCHRNLHHIQGLRASSSSQLTCPCPSCRTTRPSLGRKHLSYQLQLLLLQTKLRADCSASGHVLQKPSSPIPLTKYFPIVIFGDRLPAPAQFSPSTSHPLLFHQQCDSAAARLWAI